MKRLLLIPVLAALAACGAALTTSDRPPDNPKIWICHNVEPGKGETGNGYNYIEVDDDGAYNGHADHPGDLIPAPNSQCWNEYPTTTEVPPSTSSTSTTDSSTSTTATSTTVGTTSTTSPATTEPPPSSSSEPPSSSDPSTTSSVVPSTSEPPAPTTSGPAGSTTTTSPTSPTTTRPERPRSSTPPSTSPKPPGLPVTK